MKIISKINQINEIKRIINAVCIILMFSLFINPNSIAANNTEKTVNNRAVNSLIKPNNVITQAEFLSTNIDDNITIPIETILENESGPINGMKMVTIELWANYYHQEERKLIWSETQSVILEEGYLSIDVGKEVSLTPHLFQENDILFLLKVQGVTGAIRMPISYLPWAIKSETADEALSVSASSLEGIIKQSVLNGNYPNITKIGNIEKDLDLNSDLSVGDGLLTINQGKGVAINTSNVNQALVINGTLRAKKIIVNNKDLSEFHMKWLKEGNKIKTNQKLSIGTESSEESLTIKGDTRIDGDVDIDGNIKADKVIVKQLKTSTLNINNNSFIPGSFKGDLNLNNGRLDNVNNLETKEIEIGSVLLNKDGISGIKSASFDQLDIASLNIRSDEIMASTQNTVIINKVTITTNNISAKKVTSKRLITNKSVGIDSNEIMLNVDGGLRLGKAKQDVSGTLQFTGSQFEGFNGYEWVKLDNQESQASSWQEDNANEYVITNKDKVGIGTIAPDEKLHVKGNIIVKEGLVFESGRTIKGDKWTGDWDMSQAELSQIKTLEAEELNIDIIKIKGSEIQNLSTLNVISELNVSASTSGISSSNRVSILTNPTRMGIFNNSPQYKLDVSGTLNATQLLKNNQDLEDTVSLFKKDNDNNILFVSGNVAIREEDTNDLLTIKDTNGIFRFNDGSMVLHSTSPQSVSLTQPNVGSKLMWVPHKAAFRAGYIDTSLWGDSNLGDGTVVFGKNNNAQGNNSIIIGGESNTVNGDNSIIIGGENNTIEANNAMALGIGITIEPTAKNSFVFSSMPVTVNQSNVFLMYPQNQGNVGIGTINPQFRLDVVGTVNATGYTLNNEPLGSKNEVWKKDHVNKLIVVTQNIDVGIGTSSPQARLDIKGNLAVSRNVSITGNIIFDNSEIQSGKLIGDWSFPNRLSIKKIDIFQNKIQEPSQNLVIEGVTINSERFTNNDKTTIQSDLEINQELYIKGALMGLSELQMGDVNFNDTTIQNINGEGINIVNQLLNNQTIDVVGKVDAQQINLSGEFSVNDITLKNNLIQLGNNQNVFEQLIASKDIVFSKESSANMLIGQEIPLDEKVVINGDSFLSGSITSINRISVNGSSIEKGTLNRVIDTNQGQLVNIRNINADQYTDGQLIWKDDYLTGVKSVDVSGDVTISTDNFIIKSADNTIGIGTSEPKYSLDIDGVINAIEYLVESKPLRTLVTPWKRLVIDAVEGPLSFFDNDFTNNVGIGVEEPSQKLDVSGNVEADSLIIKNTINFSDSHTLNEGQLRGDWKFNNGNISQIKQLNSDKIEVQTLAINDLVMKTTDNRHVIKNEKGSLDIIGVKIDNGELTGLSSLTLEDINIEENKLRLNDNKSLKIKNTIISGNNIILPSSPFIGSNKIVISGDKLGIGTVPTYSLSVQGTVNASDFIVNGVSLVNNPSQWRASGINNTYTSQINVGIGSSSPKEKLDVVGNIRIKGDLILLGDIMLKDPLSKVKGGTGGRSVEEAQESMGLKVNKDILAFNNKLQRLGQQAPIESHYLIGNNIEWVQSPSQKLKEYFNMQESDDIAFVDMVISRDMVVDTLGVNITGNLSEVFEVSGTLNTTELKINGQDLKRYKAIWKKESDRISYDKGSIVIGPLFRNIDVLNIDGFTMITTGSIKFDENKTIDNVDMDVFNQEVTNRANGVSSNFYLHINDTTNPHKVTKADIELSNVINLNVQNTYAMNTGQHIRTTAINPRGTSLVVNNDAKPAIVVSSQGMVGIGREPGFTNKLSIKGDTKVYDGLIAERKLVVNTLVNSTTVNTLVKNANQLYVDDISPLSGDEINLSYLSGQTSKTVLKEGGHLGVGIQADTDKALNINGKLRVTDTLTVSPSISLSTDLKASKVQARDEKGIIFKLKNQNERIKVTEKGQVVLGDASMTTEDIKNKYINEGLIVIPETVFKKDVEMEQKVTMNGNLFANKAFLKYATTSTGNTIAVYTKKIRLKSGEKDVQLGKSVRVESGGNVGINHSPSSNYKLTVSGNTLIEGSITVLQESEIKGLTSSKFIGDDKIEFYVEGDIITQDHKALVINQSGNIGIAGEATMDQELFINGKMKSTGPITIDQSLYSNKNIINEIKAKDSLGINLFSNQLKGVRIVNSEVIFNNKTDLEGPISTRFIKSLDPQELALRDYQAKKLIIMKDKTMVGIGSENPVSALDIEGNMAISQNVTEVTKLNEMLMSRLYEIYSGPQLGEQFHSDGILVKEQGQYNVTENRMQNWDDAFSWEDHKTFNYIKHITSQNVVPVALGEYMLNSNIYQKDNKIGIGTDIPQKTIVLDSESASIGLKSPTLMMVIKQDEDSFIVSSNEFEMKITPNTVQIVTGDLKIKENNLIVKDRRIQLGERSGTVYEKFSAVSKLPEQFMIEGNKQGQLTTNSGETIRVASLVSLESHKDANGRGLILKTEEPNQPIWFAGVASGAGFQIGQSQVLSMANFNSPYMPNQSVIFFSRLNNNIGISTNKPKANLEIKTDQNQALFVDSPDQENSFVIKKDYTIGIGTNLPGFLLEVSAIKSSEEYGTVKLESKSFPNSKQEFIFDNTITDAFYKMTDSQNNQSIYLTSKGASFLNAGYVGLGTKEPAFLLDIVEDKTQDQIMRIESEDSSKAGLIRFGDDTTYFDLGLSKQSDQKLLINSATGTKAVVLQDGNIGIMTESPSNTLGVNARMVIGDSYSLVSTNSVPANTVAVQGNIGVSTDNPTERIHISDPSPILKITNTNTNDVQSWNLKSGYHVDRGGVGFSLGVSNNEVITLQKDRNVGINVANPKNTLAVNGSVAIGSNYSQLTLPNGYLATEEKIGVNVNTPNVDLDINGILNAQNTQLGKTIVKQTLTINKPGAQLYRLNAGSGFNNGDLVIQPRTSTSNSIHFATRKSNTEIKPRLTVFSNGNLGVETTTPDAKFHIVDSVNDSKLNIQATKNVPILNFVNKVGGNNVTSSVTIKSVNNASYFEINNDNNNPVILQEGKGNIGINTTNTLDKLTVSGNITTESEVYALLGNRIQAVDSNGLRLESQSKELGLFVGSNGNVGIGRTMNNPIQRLHIQAEKSQSKLLVKGGVSSTQQDTDVLLSFRGATGDHASIYRTSVVNSSAEVVDVLGIESFKQNESSEKTVLALQERGGNVGIGKKEPSESLDVNGKVKVTDQLIMENPNNGSVIKDNASLLLKEGSDWVGIGVDADYKMWIKPSNSSGVVTYLNSDGNVGIGSDSPSAKLESSESIVVEGSIGNDAIVNVERNNSSSQSVGLDFGANHKIFVDNGLSKKELVFGDSKMILDTDGNLGVLESDPAEKLHVRGNIVVGEGSGGIELKTGSIKSRDNSDLDVEVNGGTGLKITQTQVIINELNADSFVESNGTEIGIPKDGIIMWAGWGTSIPDGFVICNGSNNTPDLRDKFLVGGGGQYALGASHNGTLTHNHTHNHSIAKKENEHTFSLNSVSHNHTWSVPFGRYYSINGGGSAHFTTLSRSSAGNQNTSSDSHSHSKKQKHDHNDKSFSTKTSNSATENQHLPKYYRLAFLKKL